MSEQKKKNNNEEKSQAKVETGTVEATPMSAVAEASSGQQSLTIEEAQVIVRSSHEAALAAVREASLPRSLGPLGAAQATEADITNELEKGGPAFGSFVKAVGLAVAEAQQKLDENLVTTAKALSDNQIDVVAVFEQQIKDDTGEMDKGNIILQKLPLINYLMPTAYKWSRVYLEMDMKVREFNTSNGFNIQGKSMGIGVRASGGYSTFGGGNINSSASFNYNTSQYSGETSTSADEAAGSMHMEATLEPRTDIELPRPFILQKGPRLKLLVGTREDLDKDGNPTTDPTKIVGRQVTLTAELKKTDGSANDAKTLEVSVEPAGLSYTGSGTTNSQGKLEIKIARTGAMFDKQTPLSATVRVRFGLISDAVVVNL
jgi:hypothetical protein